MKRQYTVLTSLILVALFGVAAFAQNGKGGTTTSVTSVKDVDQPARQAFYARSGANFSNLVTVPAGKVLVIESASGQVYSAPGDLAPLTLYVIDYNADPIQVKQIHVLAPSYPLTNGLTMYTHQTKIYVPAGQTVYTFWDGDGLVSFSASISGHFIDVP
jgi:hypothetical protein